MFSLGSAIEALRANILWALALNISIAAVSFALGAVRVSGLIVGLAYGIIIYSFGGFRLFLILLFFFLVGSLASKARALVGKEKRPSEDSEGRGAGSVIGKCTVGMLLAVLTAMAGGLASGGINHEAEAVMVWLVLGYVAAFSAALADTCASELGPLHGRKAMLLTTAEAVPHGTPGGVSITGTIFGISGAMLLALVAVTGGLIREKAIILIVVSSLAAIGVESVLRVHWPGRSILAKQVPNVVVTLTGAVGAILLAFVFGY